MFLRQMALKSGFCVSFFWLLLAPILAQSARLQKPIATDDRIVLPGSRARLTSDAKDLGPLDAGQIVPGITLVFNRSPVQEAALEQLLRDQQDVTSPGYHQWLTPESFGTRFGMAESDLLAVQSWLRSAGFTISHVTRSRDRVTFSGTAEQVRRAFGTELHHYQIGRELHVAPASEITLPTALAPVTAAILHLADFRPAPQAASLSPSGLQPAVLQPTPRYTTLSTQTHYLAPADLAVEYDFQSLTSAFKIGYGQSIAVVGQSFVDTSANGPVQSFSRAMLLQSGGVSAVLVPGTGVQGVSPGDELESELDLEYASGTAQGARVFLVYVGVQQNYNVFDSLAFAIQENISPIISISYGVCEAALSSSELAQANALLAQAAAQGQTVVAASGDQGSTACVTLPSSLGLTTAQLQAAAVSFPASSPYVTAVGGTQMAPGTYSPGASTFWKSATSFDQVASLLAHVPEIVWNEGSVTTGILAGGGGVSTVFPRPAWQTGVPGLPAGTSRLLPDIALQASLASPGFLFCSVDPLAELAFKAPDACLASSVGSGTTYPVTGGTSISAPVFAGMLAILNQTQNATGQGNINPTLYSLAANPATYAAAFHDVTSGTNACVAGTSSCSAAGQAGFTANVGYDQATGLGSIDLGALVSAWPRTAASQLLLPYVGFDLAYTAAPGESLTTTINVGGSGALRPTGTLTLAVDGVVVKSALALVPATNNASTATTFTFTAPLTAGSHLFTATYSGDQAFASSTYTSSVLIGAVQASGSFGLAAAGLSIPNNTQGRTQVTLTPGSGYNGRVLWSLSASASSTPGTLCYLIKPLVVNGVSTTSLVLGAGSACNAALSAHVDTPVSPPPTGNHTPAFPAVPIVVTACAVLCGVRGKNFRVPALPRLLTLIPLAAVLCAFTGCGGSKGDASTSSPAPVSTAVTYTVTLNAQDSINTLIHASTTFTLTVQ